MLSWTQQGRAAVPGVKMTTVVLRQRDVLTWAVSTNPSAGNTSSRISADCPQSDLSCGHPRSSHPRCSGQPMTAPFLLPGHFPMLHLVATASPFISGSSIKSSLHTSISLPGYGYRMMMDDVASPSLYPCLLHTFFFISHNFTQKFLPLYQST